MQCKERRQECAAPKGLRHPLEDQEHEHHVEHMKKEVDQVVPGRV